MAVKITFALCGIAAALHLYTAIFKAQGDAVGFLAGLVVLSLAPYAVAAGLVRSHRSKWLGLGAAAAVLLADGIMHYRVFVAPPGSTAAIGLLVMPVWNLLVVGPAGAVLVWFVHRLLVDKPDWS